MRTLKHNSLLKLVNSYLIDAPQPTNISYNWNFGSLLAIMFSNSNYNRCNFSYAL